LWNPALLGAVRKSGAAYVLLVHDAELHPGEQSGLRDRILTDEIVKADGLVTMSRHVRETLIRRHGLDANRIALVPHGVDLPDPDDALARTLPDLTKRPFQLLFFGRIVAYKGVDLLLEAYRLLLERGKAVELTIAGSGQADALIESARELSGITWDVRWIAEEEIGGLVSASDLVVLPYREASQSGIAPLAATRGVPSVATPVGGLVEQVLDGTTGLLSCEVSAEAFADAICALMEDPGLYARCSQGALDHAQTTLSWAAVAGQLAPFFAQIRQSRSAHPAE
ncbi:MAG: glycosyltransferase family 4 protein, partial [Rhodospirillaceae bacterium]